MNINTDDKDIKRMYINERFDYRRTIDISNLWSPIPKHALWVDGNMYYAS